MMLKNDKWVTTKFAPLTEEQIAAVGELIDDVQLCYEYYAGTNMGKFFFDALRRGRTLNRKECDKAQTLYDD